MIGTSTWSWDGEAGFDADRSPSIRRRDRRADVFGGEDGKAMLAEVDRVCMGETVGSEGFHPLEVSCGGF